MATSRREPADPKLIVGLFSKSVSQSVFPGLGSPSSDADLVGVVPTNVGSQESGPHFSVAGESQTERLRAWQHGRERAESARGGRRRSAGQGSVTPVVTDSDRQTWLAYEGCCNRLLEQTLERIDSI
jgi:hypothetical protein